MDGWMTEVTDTMFEGKQKGNIQLCILIYVKMEMTFYFRSYFVVLNEKDILFQILQYYCVWSDQPQYMDLWVIEKKFVAL